MGGGNTRGVRETVKVAARHLMLAGNGNAARAAVLCYHSVHPTNPTASVTTLGFRRQLEWLSAQCDVVPLNRIVSLADADQGGRPVVAITFDDAFADNHEYAWPLLEEFGLPATFFVTTGLVERRPAVIARFARLLNVEITSIEPLSWAQVNELRGGGMEIGAHSVTHPNLAAIDAETARWEIEQSKQTLEVVLGEAVTAFAYPFGKPKHNFNRETISLVKEAGFEVAGAINCRTMRSGEHPLRIPRIPIGSDSLERVRTAISGGDDLLGVWQERAPRWLSHAVTPEGSHRGEFSLRDSPAEPGP